MKICLTHNEYGIFSGEEAVVQSQADLLKSNGHSVTHFMRSSAEICNNFSSQFKAFFSGIYNPSSVNRFKEFVDREKPDLIHIHNLYPLISPAILDVCSDLQLPVVMTVHNYRLICPNGLFMVDGKVCEKCHGGREYWCILKNCEGRFLKSIGYALRNYIARIRKSYLHNVHIFAALTDFQRRKLLTEGYPSERIMVVPNMSQPAGETGTMCLGDYIGYVGRVSPEKGVDTLLKAAENNLKIKFRAAGSDDKAQKLVARAPDNFHFLGHLARDAVDSFIAQSRAIVMCSICYEGFPAVLVEAMLQGRPVIASRLGGIPEVVEDGVTGLLFEAGNADDLAAKIQYLWERPNLCRQMGEAGREKALREYSPETYYRRLMSVYQKAETISRGEA